MRHTYQQRLGTRDVGVDAKFTANTPPTPTIQHWLALRYTPALTRQVASKENSTIHDLWHQSAFRITPMILLHMQKFTQGKQFGDMADTNTRKPFTQGLWQHLFASLIHFTRACATRFRKYGGTTLDKRLSRLVPTPTTPTVPGAVAATPVCTATAPSMSLGPRIVLRVLRKRQHILMHSRSHEHISKTKQTERNYSISGA